MAPLLARVLLTAGTFLGATLLMACETTLESGLDEPTANEVVSALGRASIPAEKRRAEGSGGGFDVVVPRDDTSHALAVLREESLPQREEPSLASVYGETSLVPTATEERARFMSAVTGELARSIESIEGVVDARVHVALPDPRDFLLDDARPTARASVLVRHREGRAPSELSIQRLVAFAVPDLPIENVAVVFVAAPRATRPSVESVHLGPIAVARGSAGIARSLFAAMLVTLLALSAAVAWLSVRLRRVG